MPTQGPPAINVVAPSSTRRTSEEKPTNRTLVLLRDEYDAPILVRSFRCLLKDTTYTIGLRPNETSEVITLPRGDLDPLNRAMTIVDRPYIRTEDGGYRFLKFQDVSHARQFNSTKIQTDPDDSKSVRRNFGKRAFASACVLPTIPAIAEDGSRVEIIDPKSDLYLLYNAMCRAAEWPNAPQEQEGEPQPEGTEEATYNLEDLPT